MNNKEIKNEIIDLQQKEILSKKERRRLKKLEKLIVRESETRFKWVISFLKPGAIGLSVLIVIGVVWIVFKQSQVHNGDIISRNGLHWHSKLAIYIKGEKQTFKDGIGLNGAVHNPIHTHDDADEGVVHMEFKGVVTKNDIKLGNFFKIWDKEFNSNQIFDKKNGQEGKVTMYVNGKKNTDYENYLMKDKDAIEIKYE